LVLFAAAGTPRKNHSRARLRNRAARGCAARRTSPPLAGSPRAAVYSKLAMI
jgi:hypothetical protein